MNSKQFNLITERNETPIFSERELLIINHYEEIKNRDSDRMTRVIEGAYNKNFDSKFTGVPFIKSLKTASAICDKASRRRDKKYNKNFRIWVKALHAGLI